MDTGPEFPRFPVPFLDSGTLEFARFDQSQKETMLIPEPRTVMKRRLDSFTSAIRGKADWLKIHSPATVQHWKAEAAEQDVTNTMFHVALQVSLL